MIDLLKEYRAILEEDIDPICEPLKQFGINFFHYVRRYKDNSRIMLCNRPDWADYLYQNKLFLAGTLEWKHDYYDTSYFLWSTLENQNIYHEAREYFDIDNGLTIIKKLNDGSIEFSHFGAKHQDHHVINFYLSNIDFLNRFVLHFKERAAQLIASAERCAIMVPWKEPSVEITDLKIISSGRFAGANTLNSEFLLKTPVKRYRLSTRQGEIILSSRELDCLMGILEGKTSQEIAEQFCRSKRTIEGHISNIKQKLDCSTKAELIKVLIRHGFVFHNKIWQIFS